MRRRFAFFALTGCFLGCNAILGIESGEFEPPLPEAVEAGADGTIDAPNDTGRSDGTITPSETGAPDAQPDVRAPDAEAGVPDAEAGAPDADAGNPDADAGTTCTADLQTDPKNCGACGHDCLAGTCAAAACQPYVIADLDADKLSALAIGVGNSDTNVFWTNTTKKLLQTANGTIANAPVATVLPLAAADAFSLDFSVAGDHVYFGQSVTSPDDGSVTHRVARVPQTARDQGSETIAEGLPVTINGVVADSATNIVWNEFQPGTVRRCDAIPCAAPVVVGSDTFVQHLAIGGNHIAWATLTTKLIQVSTGGGAQQTVSTGTNSIAAIVVVGNSVVYSDLSRGIIAVDLANPTDTVVTPLALNVKSLALDPDGTTLWYLDLNSIAGQSKLGHVSTVDGLPPVITTMALGSPRALAVDAKRLYWLDTLGGRDRVMAIAK